MQPLDLTTSRERIEDLLAALDNQKRGIASDAESRLAAIDLLHALQQDIRRHLGADY